MKVTRIVWRDLKMADCVKSEFPSVSECANLASARQEGGTHYKGMAIEPALFFHLNQIGPLESMAMKYLIRWRKKGGVEDLKKAKHLVELMIEFEEKCQPILEPKMLRTEP